MLIKCTVQDGFIPSEKFAIVDTASGSEQVAVSGVLLDGEALRVSSPLGKRDGQVLVELPVESTNGNWRIWVNEDQILQPGTVG